MRHTVKSYRRKTVHPSVAFISVGVCFVVYTWVISVYCSIPDFNQRPWNIIFILAFTSPYLALCLLIPCLMFVVNSEMRRVLWRSLRDSWVVAEVIDNYWRDRAMVIPVT